MPLSADISELPVGEILQLLIQTRRKGVLQIKSGDETRLFWLEVGRITLILTGSRKRFRIGDLLVRTGTVTERELDVALKMQKSSGMRIGEILQRQGKVTEEGLERILSRKFEEEIVELFMLNEGVYTFHFDDTPDKHLRPDQVVSRVTLNTDLLILEALRQIDEWQKVSQELPGFRTVFVFAPDANVRVDDLELDEVNHQQLSLIDGRRPVERIIADTAISKFAMLSLLYDLFTADLIRPLEVDEAHGLSKKHIAEGDLDGAVAYLDHALSFAPERLDIRVDKYSMLQQRKDFARALREARRIARAYMQRGNEQEAIAYLEKAHAIKPKDTGVNQMLFQLLGRNEEIERASTMGSKLVEQFRRRGKAKDARDVLSQLLRWNPDDVTLRLDFAEVVTAIDGHEAGMQEYERCLETITPSDASTRIDVLRRMIRIDRSRKDLRAELKALLQPAAEPVGSSTTKALRQFARNRTRTLLIVAGIVFALVTTNLVWNEVAARTALAEANAQMASASTVPDIGEVVIQYRLITDKYAWTTVASEAQSRLAQAQARQQQLHEQFLAHAANPPDQPPATPPDAEAFAIYKQLQAAGQLAEAARAVHRFRLDFPASEYLARLELPTIVRSLPEAAAVYVAGQLHGHTPDTLWLPAGRRVPLSVRLEGHGTEDFMLRPEKLETLDLVLERVPLWQLNLDQQVRGTPALLGGQAFLPTDRGSLLEVDTASREQTPHRLGLLGQPQRLLSAADALWAVAGDACLRLGSGGGRRASLPGCVRGLGTDGNGGLLCVLTNGTLTRLAADGSRLWTQEVAAEPRGGVAGWGALALVGAVDPRGRGQLVGVRLDDGQPLWQLDFSAHEPHVWGASEGGWLVSTPIALMQVDAQGKVLWHVPLETPLQRGLVSDGPRLLYAEQQALVCLDAEAGRLLWRNPEPAGLTAPAIGRDGRVYAGSGQRLLAFDRDGTLIWQAALEAEVACAPLFVDGRLLVATDDGRLACFLP